MVHELSLLTPHKAWERPMFKAGNRETKEVIMVSTATAFRTRITDELRLSIVGRNDRERFPLVDELAVHIIVTGMLRYRLPFVAKNVLDALKGYAYNDDTLAISICAEQHHSHNCERVSVALFVNRRILNHADLPRLTPLLSFEVDVVASDVVLPLRASPEHTIVESAANQAMLASVGAELQSNYTGQVYSSVEEVSVNLNSTLHKADIDNVALPFFMAMNGVVYQDMSDVDCVLLNINRQCSTDKADIRIIGHA